MNIASTRRAHWDAVEHASSWNIKAWGDITIAVCGKSSVFISPPGSRILEIGSGQVTCSPACHLLSASGSTFQTRRSNRARPPIRNVISLLADGHALPLSGSFDFIILSDLLNDVFDVQTLLDEVRRLSTPATRILINSYSRVWQMPLWLAEKTGAAKSNLPQNWLTPRISAT